MTILLHTTVIIDALRSKEMTATNCFASLVDDGHTFACCAINVAEVCAGMREK